MPGPRGQHWGRWGSSPHGYWPLGTRRFRSMSKELPSGCTVTTSPSSLSTWRKPESSRPTMETSGPSALPRRTCWPLEMQGSERSLELVASRKRGLRSPAPTLAQSCRHSPCKHCLCNSRSYHPGAGDAHVRLVFTAPSRHSVATQEMWGCLQAFSLGLGEKEASWKKRSRLLG